MGVLIDFEISVLDTKAGLEYSQTVRDKPKEEYEEIIKKAENMIAENLAFFTIKTDSGLTVIFPGPKLFNDCIISFRKVNKYAKL